MINEFEWYKFKNVNNTVKDENDIFLKFKRKLMILLTSKWANCINLSSFLKRKRKKKNDIKFIYLFYESYEDVVVWERRKPMLITKK